MTYNVSSGTLNPTHSLTQGRGGEGNWHRKEWTGFGLGNFQILIVSAVKFCKQCLQTVSSSGGLCSPDPLPVFCPEPHWFALPEKWLFPKHCSLATCLHRTNLNYCKLRHSKGPHYHHFVIRLIRVSLAWHYGIVRGWSLSSTFGELFFIKKKSAMQENSSWYCS